MRTLRTLLLLLLSAGLVPAWAQANAQGYDVFLLVGQSNMVGYGTIPDSSSDAAASPRVFMWDANNNVISPAVDPIVQNEAPPTYVGLGLTFGKAYAASLAANRNVLLVGAAQSATSFVSGRWQAPYGDLAVTAVSRANAAMAAAGSGARFAGILWHQGESDFGDSGAYYQNSLINLFSFFRTSITGASSTTPIVVGEFTYQDMLDNLLANSFPASQEAIVQVFHTLPDTLNNTAWVSAGGLGSDPITGDIHFGALALRQLGRRYADRLFEAAIGLPQSATSQEAWDNIFFDDGRGYDNGMIPVNFPAFVTGAVNAVADPARGTVAQITRAQGYLTYYLPGNSLNGDYTKMAWFQPGAPGFYNVLVGGSNPGQLHYLAAYSGNGTLTIEAGHSNGNSIPLYINQQVAAPAGQWIHICLVYDAGARTMTLYINGSPVGSAGGVPPAPALSSSPASLNMGSVRGQAGLDGAMAGNRVWSSALTPQQVAAVYNYELNYRAGW